MKLELIFPILTAKTVPIDHAHGLYGALKGVVPALEGLPEVGIHTIRGTPTPDNMLLLNPERSSVRIRVDAVQIPLLMPLAGKSLNVLGSRILLGVPHLNAICPSRSLWARIVTMRFENPAWNMAEAQLKRHLETGFPNITWSIRKPRTIRIHGKQILGFEVLALNVADHDSLRLQEEGFGGRRAFGCGLFVRVGDKPSV